MIADTAAGVGHVSALSSELVRSLHLPLHDGAVAAMDVDVVVLCDVATCKTPLHFPAAAARPASSTMIADHVQTSCHVQIGEDLGEALKAQTAGTSTGGLGHGAYSLKAGAGLAAAAGAGDGGELDRDSEKLLQVGQVTGGNGVLRPGPGSGCACGHELSCGHLRNPRCPIFVVDSLFAEGRRRTSARPRLFVVRPGSDV